MDVLRFLAIIFLGFTACAEFGSYAFVHPVIKKLNPRDHITVEQGLLRTFGRVMPVLMPVSLIASVAYAISLGPAGPAAVVSWIACAAWTAGLITTILVNVKINTGTARWDADNPPDNWREIRGRWEVYQAFRSWAFLISFLAMSLAVALTE